MVCVDILLSKGLFWIAKRKTSCEQMVKVLVKSFPRAQLQHIIVATSFASAQNTKTFLV